MSSYVYFQVHAQSDSFSQGHAYIQNLSHLTFFNCESLLAAVNDSVFIFSQMRVHDLNFLFGLMWYSKTVFKIGRSVTIWRYVENSYCMGKLYQYAG